MILGYYYTLLNGIQLINIVRYIVIEIVTVDCKEVIHDIFLNYNTKYFVDMTKILYTLQYDRNI